MSSLATCSAPRAMAAAFALCAACDGSEFVEGPGFTGVSYTLAFDTTGIERQGDGWSVHTDLGYTVRITEGSLTTVGTSLVACADVVARTPLQRLWPTAHAGHPGEVDPSTWSSPVTEDLVLAEPISPGGIEFPAERLDTLDRRIGKKPRRHDDDCEANQNEYRRRELLASTQLGRQRLVQRIDGDRDDRGPCHDTYEWTNDGEAPDD